MDNHFKRNLYAIFCSIVVLQIISALVFSFIVKNEKKTIEKENNRFTSYLLADELRQSSDDLTRMARIYAITGDPRYKSYFNDILEIRSGKQPRPLNYQNIYWDFAIIHGRPPIKKSSSPISLNELIKKKNLSAKELVLLEQGENLSDGLAEIETEAMQAMLGRYKDPSGNYTVKGPLNSKRAIKILHGSQYHITKEKIMQSINLFLDSIKKRTQKEISSLHNKARRLSFLLLTLMIMSIILVFCAFYLITQEYKNQKSWTQEMNSYLQESSKKLFKLWPFLITSVVAMSMVMTFSWYSLQEVQEISSKQVELSFKSRLEEAHNAVTSWFNQMHLETEFSAKLLEQNIPSHLFTEINNNKFTRFQRKLHPEKIFKSDTFSEYAITNARGIIAASSINSLVNTPFDLSSHKHGESQENTTSFRRLHIPHTETTNKNELTSKYFVFETGVNKSSTLYLFISPFKKLNSTLKYSFFGKSGDIYLVNAQGEFLSEGRWKDRLISKKIKSSIGDDGNKNLSTKTIIGWPVGLPNSSKEQSFSLTKAAQSITESLYDNNELHVYTNYIGEKVIGRWAWYPFYNFGLVLESSPEELFEFINFYETQNLRGVVFTLLLIIILTIFFVQSRSKIIQSNEKLNASYNTIKQQQKRIEEDLNLGQEVQLDMLPNKLTHSNFTLDAYLKPARIVSGDFYDFDYIDEDHLYFSIGDVSGKGVGAALFMSMAKARLNKVLKDGTQTHDIVLSLNQELSKNNASCMFLTIIVGIINLKTGKLLLTNAGHNCPFIKKAPLERTSNTHSLNEVPSKINSKTVIRIEKMNGPLVGVDQQAKFSQQEIQLSPGDFIFLYTDGVVEAKNSKNEFYEDFRLCNALARNLLSAEQITRYVSKDIDTFVQNHSQFDDITMLTLQYKGPK